jgi:transposase
MGSVVSVKAQLENQSQKWREVLAYIMQKDPTFVTRNFDKTDIEAVLSELDRLYEGMKV